MAFPPVTAQDFAEEDYIGFYNRAGDAPGVNFWIGQLSTNSRLGVAVGFAISSESLAIYPYLSAPNVIDPASYIAQIYTNVLGRAPDSAGQTFWTNRLQSLSTTLSNPGTNTLNTAALQQFFPGTDVTRYGNALANDPRLIAAAEVLTEMLNSVNAQTGTDDANLMANRITVAEDYTQRTGANNVPFSQASSHAVITATTKDPASVVAAEAITTNYISNPVQTPVNLTTGVDILNLSGANNNVTGSFGGTAGTNTYTAGDNIVAAVAGNTLTLSDQGSGANQNPTSITTTVSGVSNLVINSGEAITANTVTSGSGFTGLTQITANVATGSGTGGTTITGAGTTNITVNDQNIGTSSDTVQGGKNVIVNASNAGTGAAITVGSTTKPAGTIAVTETASAAGGVGLGAIQTNGGTTVNITENVAGAVNTASAAGAVTVNGGAATTTVTITQTAAATASAASAAVAPARAVGAVTAAPGVNGVTASTAAAGKAASAGSAGVINAFDTVVDAGYASNAAGTITSVTLNNFSSALIQDNSLATLSLTGSTGTVTLANNQASTPTTTLGLTVSGFGKAGSAALFSDGSNELKTINVTTGATSSNFSIADTNLATLNVAGASTFTLNALNSTKLATIAVSGSAGFNDNGNLAALSGTLTTGFTTTSSGTITATLDATKQTFTGSTGQDIITISADAKVAITGGSATNNELILNADASVFNATAGKLTNTNVTGFTILGLNNNSTGTWDMSTLNSSFNAIDFDANGAAGGVAYTVVKAAPTTSLTIEKGGDTISFSTADTNGAGDTTNVSINPAGAAANSTSAGGITTASLTLQDANSVGIGTVNIVSNGNDFNKGAATAVNTITNLVDNGIGALTVTGGAGLTITNLLQTGLHQTTALTITSNETGLNGTVIGTLSDNVLGNLTFAGSNSTTIGTLTNGNAVTNLTISNTGTGAGWVGATADFADSALTTLTLSGNVALNQNSATASAATGATTGFTLNGGTDNAHVNINLTGAAAGNQTDTITLGNGNNNITDGSAVGTVNITVGTGYNLINVSSGGNSATYAANVTLGAHTDTATLWDQVAVSVTGSQASGISASITGIAAGDHLVFVDAVAGAVLTASTAQQNIINNDANLTAAISHAFADTNATHQAFAFQYQGNTYVIENAANDGVFTAGTDTVVKLVGLHTVASALVGGHVVLAS